MYILPVRIKFEVIYLIFYDALKEFLTVTKQQINNVPVCRSKHLETIINWPAKTLAHQSVHVAFAIWGWYKYTYIYIVGLGGLLFKGIGGSDRRR